MGVVDLAIRGDPLLVAEALGISRRTYRKIGQNLFRAFVHDMVANALLRRWRPALEEVRHGV